MFGYIALNSTKYRANGLVVALLVVRDKVFPVPVLLIGYDFGKFINLKLLVLWRMGIIESPLLKRDISTDKVNKPANLFMLVLLIVVIALYQKREEWSQQVTIG